MSNRLTTGERSMIIHLLEREIYDLCNYRLDPNLETYVGHSQHDQAERQLAQAISARKKIAGISIHLTPLRILKGEAKPVVRSLSIAKELDE